MSRLVYFDCASGASGDMLLGALVDLGLPLDALRAELAKVPLAGYRLEARKVQRSGLQATKVDVVIPARRTSTGTRTAPRTPRRAWARSRPRRTITATVTRKHAHDHGHRGLRTSSP